MKFVHSKEIIEKFPENFTCIIGNIAIVDATKLSEKTTLLMNNISKKQDYVNDSIGSWKKIFATMGAKPKYSSSLEILNKYYDEKKKLYAISPIVDFYNAYSLSEGIPMAAYDESNLRGDIILRFAKKDEPFVPLGNPKQLEKTKNNEVIYADAQKVICRYWNLQDCHETRIISETKRVLFVFDIVNNSVVSAEDKYQQIKTDFIDVFGPSIICGLTGHNRSNELQL